MGIRGASEFAALVRPAYFTILRLHTVRGYGTKVCRKQDCISNCAVPHVRIRAVTRSYQLLQVAVPALVALAVVGVTHLLSVYRDRENKRREQRLGYLIAAFRALAKANNHPHLYEIAEELEQAVADLQVFGTAEQVKLAQKFAEELGRTQQAEIDDLLNELRNSLRKELGREPVTGNMCWMKITRKTESTK